jgi:pimeloyl-ACP methyl ester carboxylesterase
MEFKTKDQATLMVEITGEGEPILLLPGILGSTATYAGVIPKLENRYRCIAVEYVAQTQTGLCGRKTEAEFSPASHADDIEGVLKALDVEECHIVGLSYGSVIAQELAKRRGSQVKSLTLLAALLNNRTLHYRNWAALWHDCSFDLDRFTRIGLGLLFSEAHLASLGDPFETMRSFYAQFTEDNLVAFRFNLANAVAYPVQEVFPTLTCPVCLIHGAADVIHPVDDVRAYLATLDRGEILHVLEGVGHGLHAEAPDRVSEILLNFLQTWSMRGRGADACK